MRKNYLEFCQTSHIPRTGHSDRYSLSQNDVINPKSHPFQKSPIRPGPSRPLCLVNKPRTRAQVQMKEPSPVKRIMNRNQEKQSELFPERTNETASLASAKPVKKARLSTLNKLSSRRQSLTAKQSGTFQNWGKCITVVCSRNMAILTKF